MPICVTIPPSSRGRPTIIVEQSALLLGQSVERSNRLSTQCGCKPLLKKWLASSLKVSMACSSRWACNAFSQPNAFFVWLVAVTVACESFNALARSCYIWLAFTFATFRLTFLTAHPVKSNDEQMELDLFLFNSNFFFFDCLDFGRGTGTNDARSYR